jgi:hypothetical protein
MSPSAANELAGKDPHTQQLSAANLASGCSCNATQLHCIDPSTINFMHAQDTKRPAATQPHSQRPPQQAQPAHELCRMCMHAHIVSAIHLSAWQHTHSCPFSPDAAASARWARWNSCGCLSTRHGVTHWHAQPNSITKRHGHIHMQRHFREQPILHLPPQ